MPLNLGGIKFNEFTYDLRSTCYSSYCYDRLARPSLLQKVLGIWSIHIAEFSLDFSTAHQHDNFLPSFLLVSNLVSPVVTPRF